MKSLTIITILLVVCGAGGALLAADPSAEARAEPTSMMKEILASQEASRLEVAALKERFEATTDDRTALEIMREVAQIKRESRVEMMRIQLRYARQEGRDEAVVELESIIARMTAPRSKGVPIPRDEQ